MPARSEGVQRDDGVHAPVLEHALRGGGADGLGKPLEAAADGRRKRNAMRDPAGRLPRGSVQHAACNAQRAARNVIHAACTRATHGGRRARAVNHRRLRLRCRPITRTAL